MKKEIVQLLLKFEKQLYNLDLSVYEIRKLKVMKHNMVSCFEVLLLSGDITYSEFCYIKRKLNLAYKQNAYVFANKHKNSSRIFS
jgi:predicted nucleotidyltransferase